ncbi:MAG: DUF1284 domain-containing protein, partial [Candidatus Bathyarchaeia archaeon]
MLNLRAHHILCLIIPDSHDFKSIAGEMFREKGYTNSYINAYMRAFEIVRSDENVEIKILNSPKGDDTCLHCSNHVNGACISPYASVFAEWDKEIINLFGFKVGDIIRVRDLSKLVREKIDPKNMPGVCKGCLFNIERKCIEVLTRTST